ncbi:hypothetical protein FBR05_06595 [Deltaproteobacteria bacterium PRO3]|nr:hypothetical protein [Deltaproteobacteria bacterium PRO3]
MLPVILGVAAAAIFLGGCGRREDPPPAPAGPPRDPLPPENSAASSPPRTLGSGPGTGRWLVPTLVPPSAAASPFGPPQCRVDAPRPERFVVQDARSEFCRLHEVLRGGACRIEGDRVLVSEDRSRASVFSLIPNLREDSDFSAVPRNPELRAGLAQLEGLQTYLYSGRPCEFDGLQDLMDLMEAYTLYRAALHSPQAELRRGFSEGRVGCILRRGVHEDGEAHDLQWNGLSIRHGEGSRHDAIVTPATVRMEGLHADTPVSDCIVVR